MTSDRGAGERRKAQAVMVRLRRPTEFTTWRPRVEHGIGFSAFVWGVLSVVVER